MWRKQNAEKRRVFQRSDREEHTDAMYLTEREINNLRWPSFPLPRDLQAHEIGGEGGYWWCPCRLTSLPPSLGALCFLPLPWKQQSMRALKRDESEGGNIPAPHPGMRLRCGQRHLSLSDNLGDEGENLSNCQEK